MIRTDGWTAHSVWDHSATVRDLYRRRCRREEPEMTCWAQAAELLAPRVRPGDLVLDAGCGSGAFIHSLHDRNVPCEYVGIDASPTLIDIGRRELPRYGLPPDRLRLLRIEDLDGSADHVVCLNVLTNTDGYHRALDRMLRVARRTVVLRESLHEAPSEYRFVRDEYLDPGADLWVHVNTYRTSDVLAFIAERGFRARVVTDRRTGGRPESVIGHPHRWTFVIAEREET